MGALFENHHAESLTSERPAFVLNGMQVEVFFGEDMDLNCNCVFLSPLLAPRLHGERAFDPAAVHWHSRRQAAEAPRFLPGPPHHWEDGVHPEPWGPAQQHQDPGDPTAAREQHAGHVSIRAFTHPSEVTSVGSNWDILGEK